MGSKSIFERLFGRRTQDEQGSSTTGSNEKVEQAVNQQDEQNLSTTEENEEKVDQAAKAKDDVKQDGGSKATTYNLIILDESGSMSCVRSQTISGCNETLNGIRSNAKEHEDIKQFVSIYCFDTSNSRYIFENVPIENVRNLTAEDYKPNACTPLYDAIGETVTTLRRLTVNSDTVGNVTIITDGFEKASRSWDHGAVVKLISSLKAKGWVFTFMGANIDVEGTAKGLGIDSYMKFEQTDEGMSEMFEQERRSRRAYNAKMDYMRKREFYADADEMKKRELLGSLNESYFTEKGDHVAPDVIRHLRPNQIFVFGSNIYGRHNGGSAGFAVQHFGAVLGQAEGLQGQSYAIPTVGNTYEEVAEAIERFDDFVVQHPNLTFLLTAVGCGNAGYSVEQVAVLFRPSYSFGNVYVPASFMPYM